MGRFARPLLLFSLAASVPGGAIAHDALGVFEGWGAYRDARPYRCFAIAEPARGGRDKAAWRPFAAVATWPGRDARGQLNIRLRKVKKPGSPVYLSIADSRILLASGGADAWAADARADAAIVTAMRGAPSMSVAAIDLRGRPFVDTYRLQGAATAIDAAALGCARAG